MSLTRDEMARIVARDIPDGSYVNLGIGQPTMVADHLSPASGIVLHTENGMLGMGPPATGDEIDPDLTNAGKQPVTELPGASYFHHADSFAMMRGGHLDVCVLGAFYCPTAVGTPLAEGKEVREIDGRTYMLEYPIRGDVALVRAHVADRMGNLVYRKTARNFGPVMAAAATVTVAQVTEVVPAGELDPEAVVTPGIYVDRVVTA